MNQGGGFRFAIDRGGTFTDVYARMPDGRTQVLKLLSEDPANYPDAPREGIRRILEQERGRSATRQEVDGAVIAAVRMGTTVATNALLERKGARTLLVISHGLKDLLRIGQQNRPQLFALDIQRPEPLYAQVLEVDERVRPALPGEEHTVAGSNGRRYVVVQRPDWQALFAQLCQARQAGCESIAVVLAHAYAYADHEQQVAELARAAGFEHVCLSHQIMPMIRLLPRGQTTVVDAYLTPPLQRYVRSFCAGFGDNSCADELLFMGSDGGLLAAEAFSGSRALLSGPAGGVVGYAETCRRALPGLAVIGFDMGGTSTDVSRYAGRYELSHGGEVAGVQIQTPQLDIKTVAAGGGSRLFFRHGMFEIGPESAGSHPGPVCYRKNGFLTVTDANLLLGRLQADFFPKIFGSNEDQPLDVAATRQAFAALTSEINDWLQCHDQPLMGCEEVAAGFIDVANEVMARPIRAVSVQRGYALGEHALACFGGAGGQHACAMARHLGIQTVYIHRHAGILSAYGLSLARRVRERQQAASGEWCPARLAHFQQRQQQLLDEICAELGCDSADDGLEIEYYLNLRYAGTDHALMVRCPADCDYGRAFRESYQREYGFTLQAALEIDDVRVRVSVGAAGCDAAEAVACPLGTAQGVPQATAHGPCYLDGQWYQVPIYRMTEHNFGCTVPGPALLIQQTATVVIEPHCSARINAAGDLFIDVPNHTPQLSTTLDPIRLALFSHRFMSIAEQMGYTLQRTAISTNIKERCDFSCAIFDAAGALVANAPHTPVHLGAMSEAVRKQIIRFQGNLRPGDVLLCNHPQFGGSHLPDLTVITPLWQQGQVVMYVANRGHHADIGGITPGSMPPFSRTLAEEGCAIEGVKLVVAGQFQEAALRTLLAGAASERGMAAAGSRRIADNLSDLKAQVAANHCGLQLLSALIASAGLTTVQAYMGYIMDHAERAVRSGVQQLAQRFGGQTVCAEDYLDDGTVIRLRLQFSGAGGVCFDFTGSGLQQWGNLNAPPAVTMSAILYCLRCLVADEIPLNEGCLRPVTVVLPSGSLLAPRADAAVVGGNVLTSQRLVDVIFRAFGNVAASQGCMNNLTFGNDSFGYYETIGGGAGAGPGWHGCSGVHTHMTNTRITDVEILESRYPVVVREFGLRPASGGAGLYRGGDGLVRELEFLESLQVAILSERRVFAPYGVQGGAAGQCGENLLITNAGQRIRLGGKNALTVRGAERIRIETPGGGGYGRALDG